MLKFTSSKVHQQTNLTTRSLEIVNCLCDLIICQAALSGLYLKYYFIINHKISIKLMRENTSFVFNLILFLSFIG